MVEQHVQVQYEKNELVCKLSHHYNTFIKNSFRCPRSFSLVGSHLAFVANLVFGGLILLVYALASAMFGAASATAPIAALLFAVHPVHTEAVDTISGRSELLALGLSLASLLVFLRATPAGSPQRRKAAAASAVLYALGCGAKETAVLLPAVLVLHLLARDGAPRGAIAFARDAFDRVSLHVGVACLYLALRLHVLGALGPANPVLRCTAPYQCAAQTPSSARGPAFQDSIAGSNGRSSAEQRLRKAFSGS